MLFQAGASGGRPDALCLPLALSHGVHPALAVILGAISTAGRHQPESRPTNQKSGAWDHFDTRESRESKSRGLQTPSGHHLDAKSVLALSSGGNGPKGSINSPRTRTNTRTATLPPAAKSCRNSQRLCETPASYASLRVNEPTFRFYLLGRLRDWYPYGVFVHVTYYPCLQSSYDEIRGCDLRSFGSSHHFCTLAS